MIQTVLNFFRGKRQYLAAILANLSIACMGASLTWTSPMESKFSNSTESPLPSEPTDTELSWIGSILTLGSLTGPIFAGLVAQRLGRKIALLSSAIFYISAYVLFLTASTVAQIMIGRFVQGCGIGFAITITPMYVAEIATANRRGTLSSLVQTFMTLGMLLVYTVGPYVSYKVFQWIQMVLPLVFLLGFIQMPETPHFYISKGNNEAAEKSLQYLRGKSLDDLQNEFNSIKFSVEQSMHNRGSVRDLFQDPVNFRAFFICTGIILFQQFSGINPVQFYAQTIFDKTGTGSAAEMSAIILGVFQVVASIVTALLVDRIGRRPTLLTSAMGMCVAFCGLGTFFYLDNQNSSASASLSFLPVVSLVLFVVMFCIGFGPIPWVLIGEMFAPSIKSVGCSIVSSICWLSAFLTVFLFSSYGETIGSHWVFWIFAICCGFAFIFTYMFVLETKGLSLPEIQRRLGQRAQIINDKH
ncbi:facilitated trehalose transporter Tret1-like [Uranotaenia lowii]|uniref:facilitated trehalose transporter Tret1-like n=1 Tax=Uranotaenia lowii TaxID=190385 RepID=UPI002478C4DC|nr:facilitated trehalose transporter Tret1-like [Uranotaenia lowii]